MTTNRRKFLKALGLGMAAMPAAVKAAAFNPAPKMQLLRFWRQDRCILRCYDDAYTSEIDKVVRDNGDKCYLKFFQDYYMEQFNSAQSRKAKPV